MPKAYVYILKSQNDNRFYIGHTSDLVDRLRKHNSGGSKSTKSRRILDLVYWEELANLSIATKKEKHIKDCGAGRFMAKDIR